MTQHLSSELGLGDFLYNLEMSSYKSYVKAFGQDLNQVAVWPPGRSMQVGDYGKFQNQEWQKLGSIWDLIPRSKKLEVIETSHLDLMRLGSAELINNSAGATFNDSTSLNANLSIKFNKDNSVFVRASDCETISLCKIQLISNALACSGKWNKHWNFVSEVCTAGRFQVVIGNLQGQEAKISAKSSELLEAFTSGSVGGEAGIEVTGSGVAGYIGQSGPLYVSLIKIRSHFFQKSGEAERIVEYAEGSAEEESETDFDLVEAEEALGET